MVAKAEILEGESIFTEEPLISCQFSWNKAYGYAACDYCMTPMETAQENVQRLAFDDKIKLPFDELDSVVAHVQKFTSCNDCGAKFCSAECKSIAEKLYHKVICEGSVPGGILDELNEMGKKIHYPPESFTLILIVRIFAMLKANSVPNLCEKLDAFTSRSVNEDISLCHKLLGEKFNDQINEIHQAFVTIFQNDEHVLGKYLSYNGFVSLLALIGTNSQGIGTSSFANWVKKVGDYDMSEQQRVEIDNLIDSIYTRFNDTVGEFLNNEGSGLYLTQSKINHSCSPNAEITFPNGNHVVEIVAIRDIRANEEICISYLDVCQLTRSRYSRQKYLKENYIFKCECQKCREQINDPDVTSDDEEMDTDEE